MPVPVNPQSSKPAAAPTPPTKPVPKPPQEPSGRPVKSKKEDQSATPAAFPPASEPRGEPRSQMKKISRRSSKPIINWFQRKLAGTRARRASEPQRLGTRSPSLKEKRRTSVPMSPIVAPQVSTGSRQQGRAASAGPSSRKNAISLNDTDEASNTTDAADSESYDERRSSLARDSTWSPASYYEADEDASVRPLPPSSPPSPSPSRSSSSYLSDPRTFRSMAASTKPTTLLSVDLAGGMAHIAQAPPTPTSGSHRLPPYIRSHSAGPSGGSISFSALPPPSPTRATGPGALQAPQHTRHHPRDNPRPDAPPRDDASVLTLASSAFGMPGARIGVGALALSGRASLDDASHLSNTLGASDSTSHFLLCHDRDDEDEGEDGEEGEDRGREQDRDEDVAASMRALRPRSSRRNSWGSEASKWSASASVVLGSGMSPVARDRSLWTSGSYRTGAFSIDNGEDRDEEVSDEDGPPESVEGSPGRDHSAQLEDADAQEDIKTPSATQQVEASRPSEESALSLHTNGSFASSMSPSETPRVTSIPLVEHEPMPNPFATNASHAEVRASQERPNMYADPRASVDGQSLATTDFHTEGYRTASSTPLPA
ncbi:hypothetical protein OBBRIDRAFT_795371 [Obba rivulosa]|uniref:Uncharacterized protein n=1 Tax=Obba rivulosa TaxID=1052685 RepID=A0A8E2AUK0_9APHY|nr:hypothetical protein OBBRIDRAFT_795371 [Obba rivulosa]